MNALHQQLDTELSQILGYWEEVSECNCASPLPTGGCLKCDMRISMNLIEEMNQEGEKAAKSP
jgi:hypothetical protein